MKMAEDSDVELPESISSDLGTDIELPGSVSESDEKGNLEDSPIPADDNSGESFCNCKFKCHQKFGAKVLEETRLNHLVGTFEERRQKSFASIMRQ